MSTWMRPWWEALLELALPSFCELCGPLSEAAPARPLCLDCSDGLDAELLAPGAPGCLVCGRRLSEAGERCQGCWRRRPPYERFLAAGRYEGQLRRAIVKLKYGRRRSLARPLGQSLVARIVASPQRPLDLVVAIPLAPRALRQRGFNQAELLAQEVASGLGLPLASRALDRESKRVGRQAGRSRGERRAALRGAFQASSTPIFARRVLLIDDVFTTGATLRAATRALLEAGARAVVTAAVARTPAPGERA